MATLTESVNALSMALATVELQLLPVGENKVPLFKGWQKGKFSEGEIISTNPKALGVRMGDNGYEAVDVDSKNAEDPESFKKKFSERFKESGLDFSKFIFHFELADLFFLL